MTMVTKERAAPRERHPETMERMPPSIALDQTPLTTGSESVETIYRAYDQATNSAVDLMNKYYDEETTEIAEVQQIAASLQPFVAVFREYAGVLDQLRTHVESAIDAMRTQIDAIEEALNDRIEQMDGDEYLSPDGMADDIESTLEEMQNWMQAASQSATADPEQNQIT